jgi:hypothetical protein
VALQLLLVVQAVALVVEFQILQQVALAVTAVMVFLEAAVAEHQVLVHQLKLVAMVETV